MKKSKPITIKVNNPNADNSKSNIDIFGKNFLVIDPYQQLMDRLQDSFTEEVTRQHAKLDFSYEQLCVAWMQLCKGELEARKLDNFAFDLGYKLTIYLITDKKKPYIAYSVDSKIIKKYILPENGYYAMKDLFLGIVKGITINHNLEVKNNTESQTLHYPQIELLPPSPLITITLYLKKEFKKGDKVIRKSSYSGSNWGTVLKIKKESGGLRWTKEGGAKYKQVKLPAKISAFVKWDGKGATREGRAKTTWVNSKSLEFYEEKK